MDNLISVFMNYKLNRLVEYGVAIYQMDSPFIRAVFSSYFQTYIDNYYYGIFNTIDDENYNRKNLKAEFTGVMEEMLYEYQGEVENTSQEEYQTNCKIIHEFRDLSYEIVKIDTLAIPSKEDLPNIVNQFLLENDLIHQYLGDRTDKLIRLVRDTYVNEQKILCYENQYFQLNEKHFIDRDDCVWLSLKHSIGSLDVYRKGLVEKVFADDSLDYEKMESLIQKISHLLLVNFIQKIDNKKIFIELPDTFVSRGKIDERIISLMDNPMFRKNVFIAVPYNTYANSKGAFTVDFHFACMQDFRHISDVYQKVDSIYNEGFSHYLIVTDCKEDDRDFFMNYKNEVMSLMMFEEE